MTEPLGEARATSFLDSLGPRGRWRAEPRASIAIAGAGCALAVLGVLIVAGDTGASDDDFNRVPGILLSAIVVAAGFFTLQAARQGPMATAGSVAAALGVPPLVFFLTFDQGSWPPYSTEGILIVSTAAWLATYAVGPGRGRPLFLGAGLIGLWFTILQVTEGVFDAPFGFFGAFVGGYSSEVTFDETGGMVGDMGGDMGGGDFGGGFGPPAFDVPDPTTIGLLSLGLGVAYLLTTRWLDRRGHHGAATPVALATLPTLFAGVLALADDLEQAGTGLLLLALGLGLAHHGAAVGRRATAWIGGATAAVGAATFLADMTDDATIGGMLFVAAGIGLVATGHAVATALGEPDEMTRTTIAARLAPSSVGTSVAVDGGTPPSVPPASPPTVPSGAVPPPPPPPPPGAGPAPAPPTPAEDHSPWAPPAQAPPPEDPSPGGSPPPAPPV